MSNRKCRSPTSRSKPFRLYSFPLKPCSISVRRDAKRSSSQDIMFKDGLNHWVKITPQFMRKEKLLLLAQVPIVAGSSFIPREAMQCSDGLQWRCV
ncbi:hypothetical protein M758_5G030600 [Ceratodon purpureus]|nr:hypothetical protein M758_5G030600 [Ceratodon purpureus]